MNHLAAPLALACLLAPAIAWADVPPGPPPEPEPTPEPAPEPEPAPDAEEAPKADEAEDAKKDEADAGEKAAEKSEKKTEEKKGCAVDRTAGPEGLLALGVLVLGGLALRRRD